MPIYEFIAVHSTPLYEVHMAPLHEVEKVILILQKDAAHAGLHEQNMG